MNEQQLSPEDRKNLLNELINENRTSYFAIGFTVGFVSSLLLIFLTLKFYV